MKNLFLALALSSSVYAMNVDPVADQRILDCIHSDEFVNEEVLYQSGGEVYPIRIMHNPRELYLWGAGWDNPLTHSLIAIANLPMDLERYLEDMVPEFLRRETGYCIDFRGGLKKLFEQVALLHPVYFATSIADPVQDDAIAKVFQSPTFVNQVFYYQLDNEFYAVRVLYNPERNTYKAERKARINNESFNRTFSVTWSEKYGIFTNKKAPVDLLKHVESLANSSYWDWFWNIDIHNGTCVKYQYGYDYNTILFWQIDTWFVFAEGFK